jgi:hypothetical protein
MFVKYSDTKIDKILRTDKTGKTLEVIEDLNAEDNCEEVDAEEKAEESEVEGSK